MLDLGHARLDLKGIQRLGFLADLHRPITKLRSSFEDFFVEVEGAGEGAGEVEVEGEGAGAGAGEGRAYAYACAEHEDADADADEAFAGAELLDLAGAKGWAQADEDAGGEPP